MPDLSALLGLPKPLGNEFFNRASHNELVDAIDIKVGSRLVSYKTAITAVDANGKPTAVEYRRKADNTLYKKAVSSNPDANGNYQTVTETEYAADGTTIVPSGTVTYTFTYDSYGNASHDGGIAV